MTNYEYHKEVIEKHLLEYGTINLGVEGNKVKECVFIHCANCEFHKKGCNKARAEWLNSEHNPYTIPVDTPVDTKVLVSNDGKIWKRRYFSHFSGNRQTPYVCFTGGATCWSAEDTIEWRYCKLWKEGEMNEKVYQNIDNLSF